ncbi:MAG: hypothetical protein QUS14_06065 [Pyrinomonadaceae bacterium]|nr:hypothetical protein [Pyrinomonadaceae bacterium]
MSDTAAQQSAPPPLKRAADGKPDPAWLADLIEWFLNYDERTARIRHPMVEELFQWKQQDDEASGSPTYPFENAESRFAIGVFQAVQENGSEPMLGLWLNDVLAALHDARTTKSEITDANGLDAEPELFALAKAEKLTTNIEKRMYLTSCWIEALYTAEARVLGWIYQDLYGRPFTPSSPA